VRRHEQLSPFRRIPAFFRQAVEQSRMQEVLELLDADERRRRRVVQQDQIGKHLQRSIRGKPDEDGVLKWCVLDRQQQAAIRHGLGQDLLDTWNA
jgi:hypothetical protein